MQYKCPVITSHIYVVLWTKCPLIFVCHRWRYSLYTWHTTHMTCCIPYRLHTYCCYCCYSAHWSVRPYRPSQSTGTRQNQVWEPFDIAPSEIQCNDFQAIPRANTTHINTPGKWHPSSLCSYHIDSPGQGEMTWALCSHWLSDTQRSLLRGCTEESNVMMVLREVNVYFFYAFH